MKEETILKAFKANNKTIKFKEKLNESQLLYFQV